MKSYKLAIDVNCLIISRCKQHKLHCCVAEHSVYKQLSDPVQLA